MKMNGLRLGANCVWAMQYPGSGSDEACLYTTLSDRAVNIEFLNVDATQTSRYICGSLSAADKTDALGAVASIAQNACTLSLYPHRQNLEILGSLVRLACETGLLFHDLVTSGSMVTFLADRKACLETADYISRHIDLPGGRIPFHSEPEQAENDLIKQKWLETAATYVEKKIKTYGINIRTGLSLYTIDTCFKGLADVAERFETMAGAGFGFCFSSSHAKPDGRILWHVVADWDHSEPQRRLSQVFFQVVDAELVMTPGVSVVYFQGPHFGDRFGIAGRAMSVLEEALVPVLLAGFTGSCVYLVMPDTWAEIAKQALLNVFEQP